MFFPCPDPFDPPNHIRLDVISSSQFNIWVGVISQNQNGHVRGYTVYYAEVDEDGSTIVGDWQTRTKNNQYVDVTGLKFWTHYAFKAAGFTSVGPGPNTTFQIGRTNEDSKRILVKYFLFIQCHRNNVVLTSSLF